MLYPKKKNQTQDIFYEISYSYNYISFLKKKKIEREISYFLWFFIFIIVICIWKFCLFRNILILEINISTKE